jgi:hypothetical protein
MRKLSAFLIVTAVIALPCVYGIHLYRNYVKIRRELRENSARTVRPRVDDESVSEIGYIFSMRRETYIREGRLNLVWFIAVPSENTRWSCSYQTGFPDFKVGDGVRIIHKKGDVDTVDYSGYLIGLHGKEQGKATDVWALDLDDLELSVDE